MRDNKQQQDQHEYVGYFVPPEVIPNVGAFEGFLASGKWRIAHKGRWALYHIVRSTGIKSPVVAVPEFICHSVLMALKLAGAQIRYFALDRKSMQPSVKDFESLCEKLCVDMVLVPSFYGMAADLPGFESICRKHGVFMIDDAAQSFGAKVENKPVGTFGDAGFFSFSRGKSHAAPAGAFFWTSRECSLKYKKNLLRFLLHRLLEFDFRHNVLESSRTQKNWLIRKLPRINHIISRLINMRNDGIFHFEYGYLGGVLHANQSGLGEKRSAVFWDFVHQFDGNDVFRIIKPVLGTINPVKFVIIIKDKDTARLFRTQLANRNIAFGRGYRNFEASGYYDECLLEIPLESTPRQREYLIRSFKEIIKELD